MESDPRLMVTLVVDYNGEIRDAYSHLFDFDQQICWSRFNNRHQLPNPHDELLDQMQHGLDAMGRLYQGESFESAR